MTHLLIAAGFTFDQFFHPLRYWGYEFWSGIGSDVSEVTLLGLALGAYKHINCEQPHCWRPGHRHPDHGRPVCRKHYHCDLVPPHQ